MFKKRSKLNVSVADHFKKNKFNVKNFKSAAIFVLFAITAGLSYVAGVYHFQIEAAIGPVFGYKAHSGEIDLRSLQSTYSQLAAHFDGDLDLNKLIQGANKGMVEASGDNYTTYFTPEEAIEFNKSLTGNIGGGIGAEIGTKNGNIIIVRPLKNNPAIKAGLQANDVILSVNDQVVADWTIEKTVGNIRGEAGTTVKIKVLRGSEEKEFVITREIINNPSVESDIVGSLGVMTISRFDGETGSLALAAAKDFVAKGVKSVILDLRDNGGGYVSAAVDVSSLWLNDKVIVTERSGDVIKETLRSGSNAILGNLPTVVLVNGGTASASEIVSGALHDYNVAKLVGEKTFGKGSVQLPINLEDGSELKVTVAKWYTPNGINITKDGIVPDVSATLTQTDIDNSVDPQMNAAKAALGL